MKQIYKTQQGVGYTAPEMEVLSVNAEQGFSASLTSGGIEDAPTEDWGTL